MTKLKNTDFWLRVLGILMLLYAVFRLSVVQFIDFKVKQQIIRYTNQGLHINYDDISLGWIIPSVSVIDLRVFGINGRDTVFSAAIDHATLNKIKVAHLVLTNRLKIIDFDFEKVNLSTWEGRHLPLKDLPSFSSIEGKRRLRIDNIRFKDIIWLHKDDNNKVKAKVTTQDFEISGLQLGFDVGSIFKLTVEAVKNTDLTIEFPGIQHEYQIGGIEYKRPEQSLTISDIKISPLLDKEAFAQYFKSQVDRISGSGDYIRFAGFKLEDSTQFKAKAQKVEMTFNLEVYRNKNYEFTRTKPVPLPAEMLKQAGFLFDFDTLKVENAFVAYEELNKKDRNPGRIYFQNINARSVHFTNDTSFHAVTLKAYGDFMGQGRVNADIFIPLNNDKEYSMKGNCGPFELKEINSILKSSYLVEIKSGTLDTIAFDFDYNKYKSEGVVTFKYSDLKLQVYSGKDPDKTAVIKSWALNQLLKVNKINSANVKGMIDFPYNPARSFFYYWSKSLLYGMRDALIKNGAISPQHNVKKIFILDEK